MDIVDTHCHILSPDLDRYPRAPLGGKQSGWAGSRPVTAEGMVERMDEAGIARSVLVQATTAYGYDNSYVVDSTRRAPDRFVAVGTVDPLRPDADDELTALVEGGGLSGVRLFTTGSTVPTQGEWFAAPETAPFWTRAGELGVTVCLQMRLGPAVEQLHTLLRDFPDVRVLLDHMAYPDVAASPTAAGKEVAEFAMHPGLHLKLTHRTLDPLHELGAGAAGFLDPVLSAFGADRIAWGSNLPAAEQPLPELVALARNVLADLSPAEQQEIFSGTARRLYPQLAR